jgi:hypothetical protein
MKTLKHSLQCLGLATGLAGFASLALGQDTLVRPSRGGGLDTNSPMIHVDVFYDYAANQMHATLDTNSGVPKLVPLPPGYAFDSQSNYAVLNGKAYNYQYAWNPGGTFTPPAGAAVWIERLDGSPELETYDGPGNKMENPPRPYTPIFGTAGTPTRWSWYGRMAHNAYAVRQPATNRVWAEYRVYFGDAVTGARDAYASYGDATVTLTWTVDPVIVVSPNRGGGYNTNPPPMIHVDIFYDYAANEMQAKLDTNYGVPKLVPLPLGYQLDTRSNYAVLNGKAYNYQYAWNPGGTFTPPEGAAVWIERLSMPPGLENYDGPGNKMENPPRPYTPILGTAGSPLIWKWYGRMAHNAYAILHPTTNVLSADFRVYFGDAVTGARDAFASYDDATVTLTWTVDPEPEPTVFRFGVDDDTEPAPLCFLNASGFVATSGSVVNLRLANDGPRAGQFEGVIPMIAVPATSANGGPAEHHAALGSCLAVQLVSLAGPPQATLGFWESGESQPRFTMPVGSAAAGCGFQLSQSDGMMSCDPYGCIEGRHFAVTQPGLYGLGFRVVDTSTNGPGGGPIHAPSELYYMYLQAGTVVNSVGRQGAAFTATFGGEAGKNFYLERCPLLGGSAPWQTVAGPVSGVNRLLELKDPASPAEPAFYRLRASVP